MSVIVSEHLLHQLIGIQRKIEREYHHRSPDWERLLKLKKRRLAIKDRLADARVRPGARVKGGMMAALSASFPPKQMNL